jgi:hypothetical protein
MAQVVDALDEVNSSAHLVTMQPHQSKSDNAGRMIGTDARR